MLNAFRLLIVLGLLSGVVLVGQPIWRRYEAWRGQRIAHSLAEQAEQAATTGIARGAVRRIRELQSETIDTLVRLAASPQTQAALAAQEAIDAKLVAVSQTREADGVDAATGQQLAELSEALAKYADRFAGNSVRWAKRTATKVMLAADVAVAGQLVAILSNCERAVGVLSMKPISSEAAANDGPTSHTRREAEGSMFGGQRLSKSQPPRFVSPNAGARAHSAVNANAMVGANQVTNATPPSYDVARTSRRSLARDLSWIPRSAAGAPSKLAEPSDRDARSTIAVSRTDLVPAPLPPAAGVRASDLPTTEQPHQSTSSGPIVMDVPSPESVRRTNRMVLEMSRERLIRELEAAMPDPSQRFLSAAIVRELQRRGISVPDAGQRDVTADRIPVDDDVLSHTLRPGATRQELHAMTRHADPAVRSRALSLLATSDDPQLPALARERAVYDADPQVADVASRILEDIVRR